MLAAFAGKPDRLRAEEAVDGLRQMHVPAIAFVGVEVEAIAGVQSVAVRIKPQAVDRFAKANLHTLTDSARSDRRLSMSIRE